MKMKKEIALLLLVGLWLIAPFSAIGQQTTVYTEALSLWKQGQAYFEQGLYGQAMKAYGQVVDRLAPVQDSDFELLRMRAQLGHAQSALRLQLPDAERYILDFIRTYEPDPVATLALIEAANYFFDSKDYDKAIEFFARIPSWELSEEQKAEVRFKMGYAFFAKKKFREAKNNFREIRHIEGSYYYPANYYYGMCEFFEGNYDAAIKSFRLVEKSRKYASRVPYYIAQIYFAQGQFRQLIEYVEPRLDDRGLRKTKELHQLVGQAWFELGDYAEAVPHLEYYAERTGRMRPEELYQLAYAQHRTANYAAAAKNFSQLVEEDSPMGQYAMYYLGDCYLKLNNRSGARNAFGAAARMNYDANLREEALFHYAKLSYELGFDSEALAAFQQITPQSPWFSQAQEVMSDMFIRTRDYERALALLESMPTRSPQMRKAYQTVAFNRAIQLLQGGHDAEAEKYLLKSLNTPVDLHLKARAHYWLADLAHRAKKYQRSIQLANQFLSEARSLSNLPDESSIYTGNYLQGYNYLKLKNYSSAQGYFQDCVAAIKRNRALIQSEYVKQDVLGDATLRAGDCLFKRKRYAEAVRFYDEAIRNGYRGFEYAIYQKAIIEGLREHITDKIIALEQLTEHYPNSPFADDALYELGNTYQNIGQLNKARVPLEQLIAKYPASPLVNKALLKLGLIAYNAGALQTAIEYYKRVFANNPTAEEGQSALKSLEEIYLYDLGQPEEYFAFLETIPNYKTNNYARDSLSFKAAIAPYEQGDYARAIQQLTDYLRKFPNGSHALEALYARGDSYLALKQYSQAFKDYQKVIARGKSRYYLRALEKAAILAEEHEKDYELAYEYYRKLMDEAVSDKERLLAYTGALKAAWETKRTDVIAELARKVINHPGASSLQKAKAYFYMGKVAFDQKDYDTALTAFQQVETLSDNVMTAEARYLIAYIYYLNRDLTKAEEKCMSNNAASGAHKYWVAKSVLLLADIYMERGDLFSARAALEALLEQYQDGDPEILAEARRKLEQVKQASSSQNRLNAEDSEPFFEESEGGHRNN